MIKQIAGESIKLKDLAMTKSTDIIIKALKGQKGFKTSEKDMKKILSTLLTKHLDERKRDVHIIHH
jgi:hypothetical protein